MSFSEQISPLIGRCALAWFFLTAAWDRALHWTVTVQLMALQHIPAAPPMLAVALLVMVMGGVALLLGFQTRAGAMLLFGCTVLATVMMHNFWSLPAGNARDAEFDVFSTNVAIAGALLLLVGMGPGPFALDNRGRR